MSRRTTDAFVITSANAHKVGLQHTRIELPSLHRLHTHHDTPSIDCKKRRLTVTPVVVPDVARTIHSMDGEWKAEPIRLQFSKDIISYIIYHHGVGQDSRVPVYLATTSAALCSLGISELGLYTLRSLSENDMDAMPGHYAGAILEAGVAADAAESVAREHAPRSKNLLWIQNRYNNTTWDLVDGTNGPLPWFYLVNSVRSLKRPPNVVFDHLGGLIPKADVPGLDATRLRNDDFKTLESIAESELLTKYGASYWEVQRSENVDSCPGRCTHPARATCGNTATPRGCNQTTGSQARRL